MKSLNTEQSTQENSNDSQQQNNQAKDVITGLDLVADSDTQILILGSMPSVTSLSDRGYYANHQNSFWWIMSKLLNEDLEYLDFTARYETLLKHKVGLWDVIHSCQRPGSLDASIDLKTANINDFATVFARCQNIKRVGCNGGLAHKLFNGRVNKPLQLDVDLIKLPSTSPAHAIKTKEQKLSVWQSIL